MTANGKEMLRREVMDMFAEKRTSDVPSNTLLLKKTAPRKNGIL